MAFQVLQISNYFQGMPRTRVDVFRAFAAPLVPPPPPPAQKKKMKMKKKEKELRLPAEYIYLNFPSKLNPTGPGCSIGD